MIFLQISEGDVLMTDHIMVFISSSTESNGQTPQSWVRGDQHGGDLSTVALIGCLVESSKPGDDGVSLLSDVPGAPKELIPVSVMNTPISDTGQDTVPRESQHH